MYMLPLLRWGNCRWLVPGPEHVDGLVRIQYSHVTTHLMHYWLARNSTTQRTGESFQVQGITFTTHRSPILTWAIKSQGRVSLGFFLTPNMWFFQLPSNSQHRTGHPVSINLGYHICGVSANATSWGMEKPRLQCQPFVLKLSCFWTSDWKWNFPPYLHPQKLNQTSKQTQENSESLFWE